MRFYRTQNDGLYAVIHRKEKAKITFINREYTTTNREECVFLVELGYAHEGEMPEAPKEPAKVETTEAPAPQKKTRTRKAK